MYGTPPYSTGAAAAAAAAASMPAFVPGTDQFLKWLPTREGKEWLQSEAGLQWLDTRDGQAFLLKVASLADEDRGAGVGPSPGQLAGNAAARRAAEAALRGRRRASRSHHHSSAAAAAAAGGRESGPTTYVRGSEERGYGHVRPRRVSRSCVSRERLANGLILAGLAILLALSMPGEGEHNGHRHHGGGHRRRHHNHGIGRGEAWLKQEHAKPLMVLAAVLLVAYFVMGQFSGRGHR